MGAAALAASSALGGCGGPVLIIPGGALSGEVVETPVDDWSFVRSTFIDLETRPEDPYSVELNYVLRDGRIYIDPAEGRRWLDHIREDPRPLRWQDLSATRRPRRPTR